MKAIIFIATILAFTSCQKEFEFPIVAENPKTVTTQPTPEEPVEEPTAEEVFREEPNQVVIMRDFAPMLWENSQYQITEYYSSKKNLWDECPSWIKDDVMTFHESGKGWVDAANEQHPDSSFQTLEKKWKLYAREDGVKLDWLDNDYRPLTYIVVAFENGKSFTLCTRVNDSKVYYTYTLLGKK